MKIKNLFTLFAALQITTTAAWAADAFTGGNGSQVTPYQIATTDDLDLLASQVNGGTDYSNTYFVLTADITYPHTTDWDNASSTEHNYTAIGGYDGSNDYYFKGHFDGGNHTISGIRIYKSGNDDTDKYQGLFGQIGSSATVKNVIIADTRIAGHNYTGTIVAFNEGGTIENCHVLSNVAVQAVRESGYVNDHGGIAGCNAIGGTIIGCTSAAAITTASANGSEGFGGITGYNQQYGTVSNCLYLGNALGNATGVGAIVGVNWHGTVTNCYFTSTTIQGKDNSGTALDNVNSAIGYNNGSNVTNCGLAYTITLDNGVTLGGNVTVYHNLTAYGNFALVYNDGSSTTIYSTSEAKITLDYGDSPDDYSCFDNYTSSDVTITNGSFTMPAKDVTIEATWTTPVVSVTHDGTTKNYANLPAAISAAQDGDVITLLSDINLSTALTVDKSVTLDLAGHTIDRGLANSEPENYGYVIKVSSYGTLTLEDSSTDKTGTITGGNNSSSSQGGGVYVLGTFTMNGGTIAGNQSNGQGGGVYVQGTFTMNGGAITENRSNYSGGWWGASENEDVGGGVFVGYGNHFYVSGAPKITGNVFSLSGTGEPSAADLCFSRLDEDFIGLTGALTEGASIGVRSESAYTLTSEWSTYMGTNKPSDYLFSNNGFRVGISDEGEATLTSDILDLQAEIDAAEDGSTIILQKDYVSLSGDNELLLRGRALTLDLNGHTIDYSANNTSSYIIRCDEGTTLTLKDSGGEGKLIGNPDKSYFYGISYGNAAADGTINSFTMEGGTISGCENAGVYVYTCVFTMKGGAISGNVGYGVYVDSNSDMILSDGEISNNGKSGVYFSSYDHTFTMTGGKINNNHGSNGGGVYISSGTFDMKGGEISGNISNYYGGGLYCSSNFIMSGGKITDNHCASSSIYNSGGVYAPNGITISGNVTITGNTQGDSYTENNMYLSTSQKITIDAPLDTPSRIGALYISSDEYLPTSNLTIGFAEYAHWENFVVDEGSNCRLATDGEELVWTSMTNDDLSHTVTFMDGETTLLTEYVKVAENAHAVEPITPTKEGYVFVDWAQNDLSYDFSTAVTGDITLTAVWTNAVTVVNGTGSGNYAEGASVTITADEPETGEKFKEWTGSDGLTFTSGSATTATATFTMPANAVTLTATYEDIPATAPTISTQPDNLTLIFDYTTNNTLTVSATSIDGHNFSYQWYSNSNSSNNGGTAISGATSANYSVPVGKNVGTEYYYCVVTATRTDNSQTAATASNTMTVTINPAAVTLTANSGIKTYNVEEQTVSGFACSVEGLTFENIEASGSGKNAGEYDVTFTGATLNTTTDATGNYVVAELVNGTLKINKAVPDYTLPTVANQPCNAKLADIQLGSSFAFAANSAELAIGENKRMVVFTPADAANYEIVENIELTINVNGHTAGEAVAEKYNAPTCTKAGSVDSVVYCTVCNAEISRKTVEIDATGHTAGEAVAEKYNAPTCTEAGSVDSVVYCTVCKEELSRKTVKIDATGHTAGAAVAEKYNAPTCTEAGSVDSVVYCTVCKTELSRKTVEIKAAGHKADSIAIENVVAATYTAAGSYDSVIYCSVCRAEISRVTIEVPQLVAPKIDVEVAISNTNYTVGDSLKLDGGKLVIATSDSTTAEVVITPEMISGFNPDSIGVQTITVTFEVDGVPYTTTFEVEVKQSEVIEIVAKSIALSAPAKITYKKGEKLDVAGGKLTVTFSDNTTAEVELKADMVSGFDTDKVGAQTLTVTFKAEGVTLTATFDVTVEADDTAISEDEAAAVNIYAHGNTIVVENATEEIRIYNAMGALIDHVNAAAGRTEIIVNGAEGVYIVKTGNTAKRVMVK